MYRRRSIRFLLFIKGKWWFRIKIMCVEIYIGWMNRNVYKLNYLYLIILINLKLLFVVIDNDLLCLIM